MSEQQTEPIHEKQVKIENEITEQNRQRATEYMEQESSGQKQHEGKFNGTKNANQQEAVRGMAEVKQNNQDRIEAERARKSLQAKEKRVVLTAVLSLETTTTRMLTRFVRA